jgi:hypothetical protein
MVETIKGGERLLRFDSTTSVELDYRAFARLAATFGVDSERIIQNVPANPSPTGCRSSISTVNGHHFLGGTNVHV